MKHHEVHELVEYLRGEGPPLVITGSRGCGKSHLLNLLAEALEKEKVACARVSAEEAMRTAMDYGLVEEAERTMGRVLRERRLVHRMLPSQGEGGGPGLPTVDVESGRLHLLLDGLDYVIPHHAFNASFLPLAVPGSMRLVVAVSHGPIVEALAARGWRIHEVCPLEDEERRGLVRETLGDGHAQEEALVAWAHGGHPHHLLTAVALVTRDCPAPGLDESVNSVTERLYSILPARPEDVAFLAVAEHGLPLGHFNEIAERLSVAVLEPLVVMRRGFFVPASAAVAETLRAHCSEEQVRAAHRKVFEAYGGVGGLGLFREAARHLLAIPDHPTLAAFLTRLEVFQFFINLDPLLLIHCWRTMGLPDGFERHEKMLAESLPRLNVESRMAVLNNVALFAMNMWDPTKARGLQRQAVDEAKKVFPPTHGKVGIALYNLVECMRGNSDAAQEVEPLFKELLATLEGPQPVDRDYPKPWRVLRSYAGWLENMWVRREEEGMAMRERGIEAAKAQLGPRHPEVGNELMWACEAIRWFAPARSLAMAKEAHEIFFAALGPSNEKTLLALRRVAAGELVTGKSEQATETVGRLLQAGSALSLEERGKVMVQQIEIAEADDDRPTALRLHEELYRSYGIGQGMFNFENFRIHFAWDDLRKCYEAEGEFEKALKTVEEVVGRPIGEPPSQGHYLSIEGARLLWRMGRRRDAEACLDSWAKAEGSPSASSSIATLWLRSEWAREDGRSDLARELMAQALSLAQESDLDSSQGWLYVVSGGHRFLDGDWETSARHHEVGAGIINDDERHLRDFALRPYRRGAEEVTGSTDVARIRWEELQARHSVNVNSFSLDRRRIPGRALRAAWNPSDGRTLAVLDKTGQTHIFVWHAESAQLEALDQPFAKRELPKDLSTITLRWSSSGAALRFATPGADETFGPTTKNDLWVPANTLSPDGRYLAYLGRRTISVNSAHGKAARGPR